VLLVTALELLGISTDNQADALKAINFLILEICPSIILFCFIVSVSVILVIYSSLFLTIYS